MRTKPLPEAFAYGIDIGKSAFHVVAVNRPLRTFERWSLPLAAMATVPFCRSCSTRYRTAKNVP